MNGTATTDFPTGPVAQLLTGAVTAYQWTLRPMLGPHCRFHPHCSAFAKQAIARHGAARGAWLAARRVLRCNPWYPGGDDPVPPALARPELGPPAARKD